MSVHEVRRRTLPGKAFHDSSCLDVLWRQHIKGPLPNRFRERLWHLELQDAPRVSCTTVPVPSQEAPKGGIYLHICGRWPALGTLRDKHNWFSISNSSWTSGLLFLLNLHATYTHTPNTPSHPTHTHICLFSFNLLLVLYCLNFPSLTAPSFSPTPMSNLSGNPVVYTFKLYPETCHVSTPPLSSPWPVPTSLTWITATAS